MAECVGLQLAERWGDWGRGAFTEGPNVKSRFAPEPTCRRDFREPISDD